MKRYFFRIGILGGLVILGWIAVAYAQRGSNDSNTPGNPLRSQTLQQNAEPISDSIPDASALDSTPVDEGLRGRGRSLSHNESATDSTAEADVSDTEGPPLLAPPVTRRPDDRYAAGEAKSDLKPQTRSNNRNAPGRSPAPRAVSENEEPAPFHVDPFGEPTALPSAKIANLPAVNINAPASRNIRTSATVPADEYAAGNDVPPRELPNAGYPNNSNLQDNPINQAGPIGQSNQLGQNNSASEGTGQPGAKQFEGPQSPQVMIQKVAPAEIQVGRPAIFKTTVRNTGAIPAGQVEIRDMIPKGTRLLSTNPRASQGTRGEILWTLGTLRPGEESTAEMELMPVAEGEIGSVATVHFGADASVKTISTRPDIVVQTTAPKQALIGEKINLTITVSNPGSGVATGVVLEEHLPAGLQHPAGSELEYNIGVLKPGESKKLDLQVSAAMAGTVTNLLSVRADGNIRREDRMQMEVVAPKLDIALEGPKKRYLERPATYQLSVSNPGTAAAQGVELAAYLPPGMKFVSANNQGHYDEASRAVYWKLEQLPTRETGTVELVALPVEAGQQSIKLRGAAQRVQTVEKEQPVVIEGISAVMFQVSDSVDPIEVGGEATYEVRVVNQGSKAASNVRLTAVLPGELQPLAAEGPTRHAVQGNSVLFEGLARLAPKAETTYRVRVKGVRPGDLRARFQLQTDEMQSPVTKEESTQVYADE